MDENNEPEWESASNDQAFREQVREVHARETRGGAPQASEEPVSPAVTSVRWDLGEDNSNNQNGNDVSFLTSETQNIPETNANASGRRRGLASSLCSNCRSKCSLRYFLHVWDIAFTSIWILFGAYHLFFNKNNESSRSTHMILLLVTCVLLAVLNALRGFLWIWTSVPSLYTICFCGCCYYSEDELADIASRLATNLTLSLGILYGGIAGVAWFGPDAWLPWCDFFGSWCHKLIPTHTGIPIALTAVSIIELCRWIFLQGQLSSSSPVRGADYYNDDVASSHSQSSRHRPWWFGRQSNPDGDGLHEPLLEQDMAVNGQPSWAVTSWFRSPRNTNSNTSNAEDGVINGDEEDVESVLDSLGEDWASRAESDPYWWTR
ncbi:unnamed protein product [Pseudo-nitzschia multistriata]|uniref:Uncharacterized protein n=1 Tax=Pseudo-nitzschia multistriata TaxID=183589 RepID=A0A448YVY0_9STRA|nr:unnamed protein product [Pseudo-nitzschia multistriata]